MLVSELHKLIQKGKKPLIRITEGALDYNEESFDPNMIGRIVGSTIEFEDLVRFQINISDFEEHNKSVAVPAWRDLNGEARLTWFETSYYPKDGIEVLYLPMDIEVPLDFIEDSSLFTEFLSTKEEKSYIEWLEEQVLTLRKIVGLNI